MSNYRYKFSVVIPIYNVGKYLKEAIESVINQTIGFKENIQLILVNDGSKDNGEDICLKYKKIYPDNIIYIKQENSGVSVARNNGMKYAEGEYINFLDGDDKWDLNAFKKANQFFEKNKDEIDIVTCRKKYFEAKDDYHILDHKFEKTRIVDINEKYDYIHLDINTTFIKSEKAKKYQFNQMLKYGEDAVFVTKIILERQKYGVIREVVYNYRKRLEETSALQRGHTSKDYYIDTLEYFHKSIINLSMEKFGVVIPYIQYLLMYDLQWRIKNKLPNVLSDAEKKKYVEDIISILKNIDDAIICGQKNIFAEHKIYALSLKYGKDIKKELIYINGKLYFNNLPIYNIKNNKSAFKIDILEIENGELILEGRIRSPINKELYEMYLNINSTKKIKMDLKEDKFLNTKSTFGMIDKILYHYTYILKIPLKEVKKISITLKYKDQKDDIRLLINFKKFAKISNGIKNYYVKDKYILRYENKNILVNKNRKKNRLRYEKEYWKELWKNHKYNIIFYRLLYFILKQFQKKEIWLISDRENKANDNGEHLFRYIQTIKNKNIKPYFLIAKNSEDYCKMKKVGKVIKANTLKHKIYFLMASKIISSQANEYVTNPFDIDDIYFRDLNNFDFVFLQHGITKDDLSKWLNKYSKNIKLFITAGRPEYNSIINGEYEYNEKQVKLTGFPRHDKLISMKSQKEKKILIIPTWRKTIKGSYIEKTGESIYLDTFKNTEYFKFYNNLINDERIIKALKENGYKCKMCLHPSHYKQYIDFKGNDYVEINHGFVDYQEEFTTASLLVTDYSSVFFDFAYLKKPIIYSQFDVKEFFNGGHAYEKGYFDYEKDGFGPVCYDYETTIKEIVDAIKNDCKLEEKYLDRIKKFYYKFDTNNCKRVYEEILKI